MELAGSSKTSGGADRRETRPIAGKAPALSGAAGDKDSKDNVAKSGPQKKAPAAKVRGASFVCDMYNTMT